MLLYHLLGGESHLPAYVFLNGHGDLLFLKQKCLRGKYKIDIYW